MDDIIAVCVIAAIISASVGGGLLLDATLGRWARKDSDS